MTGPIWRLVPILAGLLLALTYLLVRGASPDPVMYERILQALHELTLYDAALHRDMLRARAGLLPNYDPLVEASRGVSEALETLGVAASAPYGGSSAGVERRLRELVAYAAEQEALVETFKSDNALLQNSLAYFSHASRDLGRDDSVATEVGALVNAMLQFMRDPQDEAAAEAKAALKRLVRPPDTRLAADADTLVAHGRLILNTLPEVDRIVGRVLNGHTAERARALQATYLDYHAGIEARASTARILLYLASVLLLGYLAYLFFACGPTRACLPSAPARCRRASGSRASSPASQRSSSIFLRTRLTGASFRRSCSLASTPELTVLTSSCSAPTGAVTTGPTLGSVPATTRLPDTLGMCPLPNGRRASSASSSRGRSMYPRCGSCLPPRRKPLLRSAA